MPRPKEDRQLPIPPEADGSDGCFEVLRAWLGSGTLHCSLRPEIWADAHNWGFLLADLARYVAQAMHEHTGAAPEASLRAIRRTFDDELRGSSGPSRGPRAV